MEDRMNYTVVSETVKDFLDEAPRVGYCFRCSRPVDPNYNDWAAMAKVGCKVGNDYLVGGVLCSVCVTAWSTWVNYEGKH